MVQHFKKKHMHIADKKKEDRRDRSEALNFLNLFLLLGKVLYAQVHHATQVHL